MKFHGGLYNTWNRLQIKDASTPCEDKVQVVHNAPQPENVAELRSILSLVHHNGKVLLNLSPVVNPLKHCRGKALSGTGQKIAILNSRNASSC